MSSQPEPHATELIAPRGAEVARALGLLFGGTFALLALQLAFPPIAGATQLGLALLLLQIPWWTLPRGQPPEVFGCRFTLGPRGPGLRLGLLTLGAIAVPFLVGFHLLQREVLGRPMDWSLSHLPRWNVSLWGSPEDLEYAPADICGARRALVWTQPRTLWVMAPADRTITVTTPPLPARMVRCGAAGTPSVGPLAGTDRTSHTLAPRTGLQLSLGDADHLSLELRDAQGQPLPADAIALGARGVSADEDGRVAATRDLWWLLSFVIVQLGLVALPEEHFFRGYLQGRLDARWGTPFRLLGASVGWGLPASALAFALLHPILIPGADRLLVFFPSLLFGWVRARQGHLGAAVLVHAGCNLLLAIAVRMVGQTSS
jgi:hypothetical protein